MFPRCPDYRSTDLGPQQCAQAVTAGRRLANALQSQPRCTLYPLSLRWRLQLPAKGARMRRIIAKLAISLALVLSLPQTAVARPTAYGSTPIGSFGYSWGGVTINVPVGCFFTHTIRGDGRRITNENAGTDCSGIGWWTSGFCNWRIDFIYYDTNNRHYLTHSGPTHNKCAVSTFRKDGRDWTVPRYGRSCATFSVNGRERARQCHSIIR